MTATLSDVLPAAAAALGVPLPDGDGRSAIELPRADRVVVVLVDGLGEHLLAAVGSHAAHLNSMRHDAVLHSGFPSTTATSMGSFGTGLPPGAHGLVGYEVYDPARGRAFNELSWDEGPDPRAWQPHRTVFEQVVAAGVPAAHIGPGYFEGSGLTVAALRGPTFISAGPLSARVDAAVEQVRRNTRSLVYLYWGDVDRVGHELGVASRAWLREVEAVDLAVRTLMRRLPAGTLVVVTADHGMVDVPFENRIDLADDTPVARTLRDGVRVFAGEPRAPMLHTEPGTAAEVAARWRDVLGDQADVLLKAEVLERGWFGPVEPRVVDRIGDVCVTMTAPTCVHDSRSQRRQLRQLVGMHGSRTPAETAIPLLVAVV
ncbi:MAG: alkaline phosphatase family protein [Actinomycetales bacterium]